MKYTKEKLEQAASRSRSVTETCFNLGLTKPGGSIQTHIRNQLRKFNIDTSHFTGQGWQKGLPARNKRLPKEILREKSSGTREKGSVLRNALLAQGRDYQCAFCGNTGVWQDRKMTLEVHHRDWNWLNNKSENLEFVCPNCHSQIKLHKAKMVATATSSAICETVVIRGS